MKKIILLVLTLVASAAFVSATTFTCPEITYVNTDVNIAAGGFAYSIFSTPYDFSGYISILEIHSVNVGKEFYWEVQRIETGTTVAESWTGAFSGISAVGLENMELGNGLYLVGLRNYSGGTLTYRTLQTFYSCRTGGLQISAVQSMNAYWLFHNISFEGDFNTPPQNVVNIFVNNVLKKTYGQSSLYLSGRYIQSTLGDYTQLISSPHRSYTEL